jgi:hypothetical protein
MIESRLDDESLMRSCLSANQDSAVKAIEQEWDEICDAIEEQWSDQILD